jgi:hypothetical protein
VTTAAPAPLALLVDGFTLRIEDARDLREAVLHVHGENAVTAFHDGPDALALGGAPLASWLLARLSALFGAQPAGTHAAVADGGCYNIHGVVHDPDGTIVGDWYAEGWDWYCQLELRTWLEPARQAALERAVADRLWSNPKDLRVCRAEIRDPERDMQPFEFGWDGTTFLGRAPVRP